MSSLYWYIWFHFSVSKTFLTASFLKSHGSHSCCPVHHLLGTVAGALSSSSSPMLLLIANIASSILVIAASKLSSILRILSVVTSISDNQARMLGRDEGFNQYSNKFKFIMMTIPENKGQHKSGEEEVTKQKKDNQHYHQTIRISFKFTEAFLHIIGCIFPADTFL